MSARLATVCILTYGEYTEYYSRCLDSVLATTPPGPAKASRLRAVGMGVASDPRPAGSPRRLGPGPDHRPHRLVTGAPPVGITVPTVW
jgi:hypothetical protein